ncbi:MAG: DNA replication complex GINS family protein [Nitrososphaerota archaeon]|nr:DNA replication complex GINS family protein [Nitrososphaerota archaeon]
MAERIALQSIRDREFAYLLSGSRLKAKQRIPKTDVGSVHIDQLEQGDYAELPRWIAEVLINLGLCESQEESFSSEVFKAVNREKIAGQDQLATLRPDFYLKIRRHLAYANDASNLRPSAIPELDKTKTMIYDLIALRLRKILSAASSISPSIDIKEKLTPEEYQIFDTVYGILQSWRAMAMEGK